MWNNAEKFVFFEHYRTAKDNLDKFGDVSSYYDVARLSQRADELVGEIKDAELAVAKAEGILERATAEEADARAKLDTAKAEYTEAEEVYKVVKGQYDEAKAKDEAEKKTTEEKAETEEKVKEGEHDTGVEVLLGGQIMTKGIAGVGLTTNETNFSQKKEINSHHE